MLPFELTKDTPYLALSGELWSVFYEYFNKNWPCYKGFLLYKRLKQHPNPTVDLPFYHKPPIGIHQLAKSLTVTVCDHVTIVWE